jgi:hypothetical protein
LSSIDCSRITVTGYAEGADSATLPA